MVEMTAREAIQNAMKEIDKLRDKNDSEIHFTVCPNVLVVSSC